MSKQTSDVLDAVPDSTWGSLAPFQADAAMTGVDSQDDVQSTPSANANTMTALLVLSQSIARKIDNLYKIDTYFLPGLRSTAIWQDQGTTLKGKEPVTASGRHLCLLSIDNGGVRGLATLFMLRQALSYVGSPKPCDFFDMIAGTGTGGSVYHALATLIPTDLARLIAIMLGRLEMPVQACIDEWSEMMKEIFKKKPHTYVNPLTGRVSARYDEEALERRIKKLIKDAGYAETERMRGSKRWRSKCKT